MQVFLQVADDNGHLSEDTLKVDFPALPSRGSQVFVTLPRDTEVFGEKAGKRAWVWITALRFVEPDGAGPLEILANASTRPQAPIIDVDVILMTKKGKGILNRSMPIQVRAVPRVGERMTLALPQQLQPEDVVLKGYNNEEAYEFEVVIVHHDIIEQDHELWQDHMLTLTLVQIPRA